MSASVQSSENQASIDVVLFCFDISNIIIKYSIFQSLKLSLQEIIDVAIDVGNPFVLFLHVVHSFFCTFYSFVVNPCFGTFYSFVIPTSS